MEGDLWHVQQSIQSQVPAPHQTDAIKQRNCGIQSPYIIEIHSTIEAI